ncbi:DUF3391 domain-containing protein [Novosphingobium sp.]|uniref:HD-GYP domain-containing protein n=1 Tax=Novosphingobium sp. TaxID=1874826 RepID=UPI0033423448
MHKRIDPSDVVLGMYIHKLEGNWFSHPFWRARFLLTDPDQLEQLRTSDVPGVIIDTERGIDPDAAAPASGAEREPRRMPAGPVPPQRRAALTAPLPLPAPPPPPPASMVARVLSAPPAEVARGFGKAQSVAERGLKVVAHVFLEMRLGKTISLSSVSPVIDSIMTSMQSNPYAFNGLLQFRRDNENVYRHALATSALMIALGRTLRLQPMDLHAAGLAGLLLDNGVGLLPNEQNIDWRSLPADVMQRHVPLGHDFIVRSQLSDTIARACLEHHERFDGGGWPHGTGGNRLSRLGRMAAICDAFDLLASGAADTPKLDPGEALRMMKADNGAYDPEMLSAFETTIGIWPTGSVVALQSGRLAVVIDQHRDAPDQPLVAVFFDTASGQRIDKVWIDMASCYGADAIAGPAEIGSLPQGVQAVAAAALAAAVEQVMPAGKRAGRADKAA